MGEGTRQRRAVLAAVERFHGAFSAQELHRLLLSAGDPVGLTTVYRQLRLMLDIGLVDLAAIRLGERLYCRRRVSEARHWLVCSDCDEVVELDPPPTDWGARVARRHGFTQPRLRVQVTGRCAACGVIYTVDNNSH